jgi:amino acid transporter
MGAFWSSIIISTITIIVSLVSIINRYMKEDGEKNREALKWYIIFSPFTFLLMVYFLPIGYLEPCRGKVVDKETKRPIAGASVVAIYHVAFPTVAGTVTIDVDAQETKTDEKGEFHVKSKWYLFSKRKGDPYAEIRAWKPGYSWDSRWWENWANAYWCLDEWSSLRMGNPPYWVYELRKLDSMGERENILGGLWFGSPSVHPKIKTPYFAELYKKEEECLGIDTWTEPRDPRKESCQ